jgi:hypothetical protein
LTNPFSARCLSATRAKELKFNILPSDSEFVDHGGDCNQLHFGGFIEKSFIKGLIEEYDVVGDVFYFSLGPFFLSGLDGRCGSLGNSLFSFLSSCNWLFSLKFLILP